MADSIQLNHVKEWSVLRSFTNLLHKESRAWWGTRRWWINAILWPILLCGLMANMLFVPAIANLASEAEISQAGSLTAYVIQMGLSVFFEFGMIALGIGAIILLQDSIIGEKQSGTAEWLLSKPVVPRAYVLAKFVGNTLAVLSLMLGGPIIIAYSMLSIRLGELFPVRPFLLAAGIMTIHTLFYLALTLMLGTIFSTRGPVLGIGLASILGGNLLAGLFKPLFYVTPWILPKTASLSASGLSLPPEMGIIPLTTTFIWILIFILLAIIKFENTEL
ncbi:MAG: hypothetical protein KatS3mg046_349 [Bellilinea sp.]|nr:MAG: hypothetical protein KatS3mg046_349 [Bellilinea sp.]